MLKKKTLSKLYDHGIHFVLSIHSMGMKPTFNSGMFAHWDPYLIEISFRVYMAISLNSFCVIERGLCLFLLLALWSCLLQTHKGPVCAVKISVHSYMCQSCYVQKTLFPYCPLFTLALSTSSSEFLELWGDGFNGDIPFRTE